MWRLFFGQLFQTALSPRVKNRTKEIYYSTLRHRIGAWFGTRMGNALVISSANWFWRSTKNWFLYWLMELYWLVTAVLIESIPLCLLLNTVQFFHLTQQRLLLKYMLESHFKMFLLRSAYQLEYNVLKPVLCYPEKLNIPVCSTSKTDTFPLKTFSSVNPILFYEDIYNINIIISVYKRNNTLHTESI